MPPIVNLIFPSVLGSGKPARLLSLDARFEPKTETIEPGASSAPGAKLAALTTPPDDTAGGGAGFEPTWPLIESTDGVSAPARARTVTVVELFVEGFQVTE